MREKCPNTEFSGPYIPVFGLNTGKCGPGKTPYLDNFHKVIANPLHISGIYHENIMFTAGIGK